jgi:hypothetical protein
MVAMPMNRTTADNDGSFPKENIFWIMIRLSWQGRRWKSRRVGGEASNGS